MKWSSGNENSPEINKKLPIQSSKSGLFIYVTPHCQFRDFDYYLRLDFSYSWTAQCTATEMNSNLSMIFTLSAHVYFVIQSILDQNIKEYAY